MQIGWEKLSITFNRMAQVIVPDTTGESTPFSFLR
jgi:hypothetical protein